MEAAQGRQARQADPRRAEAPSPPRQDLHRARRARVHLPWIYHRLCGTDRYRPTDAQAVCRTSDPALRARCATEAHRELRSSLATVGLQRTGWPLPPSCALAPNCGAVSWTYVVTPDRQNLTSKQSPALGP